MTYEFKFPEPTAEGHPTSGIEVCEQRARQRWVDDAKMGIIRSELQNCYLRNGVNHIEMCKEIRDLYHKYLAESQFSPKPINATIKHVNEANDTSSSSAHH
eukprot:Colp12_sorted_trinity150504_noHs@3742